MSKIIKNTYMTNGINALIEENNDLAFDILIQIEKFKEDDWGDLCESDKEYQNEFINDWTYPHMGVYHLFDKTKIWIISGISDNLKYRIATVLLPSEY